MKNSNKTILAAVLLSFVCTSALAGGSRGAGRGGIEQPVEKTTVEKQAVIREISAI